MVFQFHTTHDHDIFSSPTWDIGGWNSSDGRTNGTRTRTRSVAAGRRTSFMSASPDKDMRRDRNSHMVLSMKDRMIKSIIYNVKKVLCKGGGEFVNCHLNNWGDQVEYCESRIFSWGAVERRFLVGSIFIGNGRILVHLACASHCEQSEEDEQ